MLQRQSGIFLIPKGLDGNRPLDSRFITMVNPGEHTGDILDFADRLVVDVPAQPVFINRFAALGTQVGLATTTDS
jgi:hypothetical protein